MADLRRQANRPITILMAEDDPEDQMLVREGLAESRLANDLHIVENGEELMDYLRRCGQFDAPDESPCPGLILLDLNMPRMNGREALELIKADPDLRCIPVVVLTSSKSEADIVRSYNLGANSYITKPVTFEALAHVLKILGKYWFEIVELPRGSGR